MIKRRDFSHSLLPSSAILKDQTIEFLASLGRMRSREHLSKVLAGQWLLEAKYGADVYAVLSSSDVPAFKALPAKPRGAKRAADSAVTDSSGSQPLSFEITTQEQVRMAGEPSSLGEKPGKRQRVSKQAGGTASSGARGHEAPGANYIAQMPPSIPQNMLPQFDPRAQPQPAQQWHPYPNPTMYNHPPTAPVPVPPHTFTFTNKFTSFQNYPPPPP